MKKTIPLSLKIVWLISSISFVYGTYIILKYPDDINNTGVSKREGIVEKVVCKKGRRDHSAKYIYVSGSGFDDFYFHLRGQCDTLISKITGKNITAYGHRALVSKTGFIVIQISINQDVLISSEDSKKRFSLVIRLIFIIVPLIASGSMTVGFYRGEWSKKA